MGAWVARRSASKVVEEKMCGGREKTEKSMGRRICRICRFICYRDRRICSFVRSQGDALAISLSVTCSMMAVGEKDVSVHDWLD